MRLLLALLPLALAGCDTQADDTGGGDTDADTDADLSYAMDIQTIWNVSCGTGCHMGTAAGGGLPLDADRGYTNLVNVASQQAKGLDRVEPGDHLASYLWRKLDGSHIDVGGVGDRMPGGGSLDAADIATVEAWIDAGALP